MYNRLFNWTELTNAYMILTTKYFASLLHTHVHTISFARSFFSHSFIHIRCSSLGILVNRGRWIIIITIHVDIVVAATAAAAAADTAVFSMEYIFFSLLLLKYISPVFSILLIHFASMIKLKWNVCDFFFFVSVGLLFYLRFCCYVVVIAGCWCWWWWCELQTI